MEALNIWNYLTIISAILITLLVLVQTRGASLGAGLGGSGDINTTRRGTDKTIYQLTWISTLIFGLSLIASIILN